MFELIECTMIMLELLEKLKNEGKITHEEYESHIKLKRAFLSRLKKCNNSEGAHVSSHT